MKKNKRRASGWFREIHSLCVLFPRIPLTVACEILIFIMLYNNALHSYSFLVGDQLLIASSYCCKLVYCVEISKTFSIIFIMTRSIPFHNVDEKQTCDKEAEVDEYKITENTPYISSIDVEDEILTIFNPSPKSVNLSHYYVKDDKDLHQLTFPEGTEIESKGVLYIYTCPGAHKGAFENPNILWRNMDGSLRRKEVLNNGNITRNSTF